MQNPMIERLSLPFHLCCAAHSTRRYLPMSSSETPYRSCKVQFSSLLQLSGYRTLSDDSVLEDLYNTQNQAVFRMFLDFRLVHENTSWRRRSITCRTRFA
jgi:hypothetical protein